MTQTWQRALLGLGLLVVLSGCGGAPDTGLRDDVAALTDAANARDPDGVRERVRQLLARVEDETASGALTAARAQEIRAFAVQVADGAQSLADPPQAPPVVVEPPAPAPERERAGPDDDRGPDDERDEDRGGKGKGKGSD